MRIGTLRQRRFRRLLYDYTNFSTTCKNSLKPYSFVKLVDRRSCAVMSSGDLVCNCENNRHSCAVTSDFMYLLAGIIFLTVSFYYCFKRALCMSPIHYSLQCGM